MSLTAVTPAPLEGKNCEAYACVVSWAQRTSTRLRSDGRGRHVSFLGQGDIGACWVWTASTYPGGYGQACVGHQKVRAAHHVAFELGG